MAPSESWLRSLNYLFNDLVKREKEIGAFAQFTCRKFAWCQRRDSIYPSFCKSLISRNIASNTHEYRRFFDFRPVCPVEPISAFYGQDGQEASARGADRSLSIADFRTRAIPGAISKYSADVVKGKHFPHPRRLIPAGSDNALAIWRKPGVRNIARVALESGQQAAISSVPHPPCMV